MPLSLVTRLPGVRAAVIERDALGVVVTEYPLLPADYDALALKDADAPPNVSGGKYDDKTWADLWHTHRLQAYADNLYDTPSGKLSFGEAAFNPDGSLQVNLGVRCTKPFPPEQVKGVFPNITLVEADLTTPYMRGDMLVVDGVTSPVIRGGAIAHDAAEMAVLVTATSITLSHTCTGTGLILAVGCCDLTGSAFPTGATYNAGSMGAAVITGGGAGTYTNDAIFAMCGPATGAHNVVVTWAASHDIQCAAQSVTGGDASTPTSSSKSVNNAGVTGAAGASLTLDTPAPGSGDYMFDVAGWDVPYTVLTFGAGQTSIGEESAVNSYGRQPTVGDGKVTYTWTGAGTFNVNQVAVALKAAATGIPDVDSYQPVVQTAGRRARVVAY